MALGLAYREQLHLSPLRLRPYRAYIRIEEIKLTTTNPTQLPAVLTSRIESRLLQYP
jgi:hypothetical protein